MPWRKRGAREGVYRGRYWWTLVSISGSLKRAGGGKGSQNPSPCRGRQSQASLGGPHTLLLRPGQPGASWSSLSVLRVPWASRPRQPDAAYPDTTGRPEQQVGAPGPARPLPESFRVQQLRLEEGSSLPSETAAGSLNSCCICVQIPLVRSSGVGAVCAAVGTEPRGSVIQQAPSCVYSLSPPPHPLDWTAES